LQGYKHSTAELQQTHFTLGQTHKLENGYQSMYSAANASKGPRVGNRIDPNDLIATKTSINLGKQSGNRFCTTSGRQYIDQPYGVTVANKDFIHDIKSNHFDTRDGRPRSAAQTNYHYTSNAHASFNYKGQASQLAAKLDES
jgi:hypothetical protein